MNLLLLIHNKNNPNKSTFDGGIPNQVLKTVIVIIIIILHLIVIIIIIMIIIVYLNSCCELFIVCHLEKVK